MGGLFIFRNDDVSKNIIHEMIERRDILYKADILNSINEYSSQQKWYMDQFILSHVFLKSTKKNIPIHILHRKWFDFKLNDNSYVFMSKGTTYSTDRKQWIKIIDKNKKNIFRKH